QGKRPRMQSSIKIVAFDADDTLWQNEEFFREAQDTFTEMLAAYVDPNDLHATLQEVERSNIQRYGYGIKGFTLSMIETAIAVSNDKIPAQEIHKILDMGREMLGHPVRLLPGVETILAQLAPEFHLALITKGDLLHQEEKLAQSGLADHFDAVHIVSEKTPQTYERAFGNDASQAMMIGNSMKSDIVPAIAAGAYAVHVPAKFEWALERAPDPVGDGRFYSVNRIDEIAEVLTQIR
ncbi:MAG: HAD family hydrolase, partial [Planktomarina sp.]